METGLGMYLENGDGIFSDAVYTSLEPDVVFEKYIGNRQCTLEKEEDTLILTDSTPRLEYYYFFTPAGRSIRCN
jgi:hypothetical protein